VIQTAPDPVELEDIVANTTYKQGWTFELADMDRDLDEDDNVIGRGLTLDITALTQDSYHPEHKRRTRHLFIVPAATFDRGEWQRWVLDRIIDVETHEACEFYQVGGTRPYAPHHAPGRNPYVIHELGSDLDVRTSFRGVVKPREDQLTPATGSPTVSA
jgi:hypothetical protein